MSILDQTEIDRANTSRRATALVDIHSHTKMSRTGNTLASDEPVSESNRNESISSSTQNFVPDLKGVTAKRLPSTAPCDLKINPPSSANILKKYCDLKPYNKTPCVQIGNSKCYCSGGLVNCSGKKNIPNLAYIPKLPAGSVCLYFANNNAKFLQESFFANVSNIRVLDFSNNALTTVSAQTFSKLKNLEYLILNSNSLNSRNLINILRFAPSYRLDLIGVHLDGLSVFKTFTNITTKQIVMDFNFLQQLDLGEMSTLKNIQLLSCRCCNINGITSAYIPTLTQLDLRNNNITDFPKTCRANSTISMTREPRNEENEGSSPSFFPSLSQLYLDSNQIVQLPESVDLCVSQMNVLSFAQNNITRIPSKIFASLTRLTRIDMKKMANPIQIIESGSFGAPSLSTLYLNRNNISFGHGNISRSMFEGAHKLRDLYIDHNRIGSTPVEVLEEIFNFTANVEHLYMSDSGLTAIPVSALNKLTKLQSLFIYNNKIQAIPDAAFDRMISLRRLNLQNNQISLVRETSFSPETIARLIEIDLSHNMFLCNCDLLWFQSWLKSNGSRVFDHNDSYICSDIHNVRVQDYKESLQACYFSRSTYIIFVVCLSIFLFAFLLFAALFRYRWQIRLMLYERKASLRDNVRMQGEFKFDIFIIYSNEDSDWVEKCLLSVVETKWKLKACIHGRDFRAGAFIVDNMVDCMNSSKRIMAVISSEFAKSSWCNFELKLCQSHVITHDLPSLLVVQMDEIESRDMRSAMYALHNSHTFLMLPDPYACADEKYINQQMEEFWKRLHDSLKNLMPEEQKNFRQIATQTSVQGSIQAGPPNRRPLARQMSEQVPKTNQATNARNFRRLQSEMPSTAYGSSNLEFVREDQRERVPILESDELDEQTSVMRL
ncbi:slit 2 protein [Biomphalaria glabrata]|nr:slit 2 protein [Biomphalaria glabrata]